MPEFNPDDYKTLEHVGDAGKLRVTIMQYKDNAPKIKIARTGVRKDGTEYHGDMGGLTAEEAAALAPLLTKAARALKAA